MTPDKFHQAYQQGLTALDAQLARVKREVATLAAARPADPDVIAAAVLRAQQAAEAIGSIVAEAAAAVGDPPPLWTTREELESTAARILEKLQANVGTARRARLQAIAGSLLVAQVLHPRWRKVVPALDALRLRAAKQVQDAAEGINPPDLPGPADGGAWLAWAWELPTEEVEESLSSVRAVVPALVEVVLEIDPGHWVVIAEAIAMPEPATATAAKDKDPKSDEVKLHQAEPMAEAASSIMSGSDSVPIAEAMPSGTVLPSESWIGANSTPRIKPGSSHDNSSVLPGPRAKPKNNLPELPRRIDSHKDKKES
ncbi:MAG: periplasmic heavy metal sensor [Planctomycetes bacterium]|nr:periplasmic heavy metal sensor [Planctomycetota bacterium]